MVLIPIEEINYSHHQSSCDSSKVERLAKDISRNGLNRPLEVYKEDGFYEISDGNHRILALKKLGWAKIPCIVLTEEPRQHPYPREGKK